MQASLYGLHSSGHVVHGSQPCGPPVLLRPHTLPRQPWARPDQSSRLVTAQARGRPRKTVAPEDLPEEPEVPQEAIIDDTSAQEAAAAPKRRRTRSKTAAPVPAQDEPEPAALPEAAPKARTRATSRKAPALMELQPELDLGDEITSLSSDTQRAASSAAALYEQAGPGTAELDIKVVTEKRSASKGGRPPRRGAATEPATQPAEGGYGVQAGLPYDSYEKTILRGMIGHDIYQLPRNLSTESPPVGVPLPKRYQPPVNPSIRDVFKYRFDMAKDYWEHRREHQEYVHDLAFQAHHRSREQGENIYANTRRVAGLMAAFENDDFMLQEKAPSSIAPWARAELVFATELDDFNARLKDQTKDLTRKLPSEVQEEELDLLDEALFLLRTDDDNAAADRAQQQSAEQELLDTYLEGMLPGATLDNLAAAYADDIFGGADRDGEFDDDSSASKAAPAEEAA